MHVSKNLFLGSYVVLVFCSTMALDAMENSEKDTSIGSHNAHTMEPFEIIIRERIAKVKRGKTDVVYLDLPSILDEPIDDQPPSPYSIIPIQYALQRRSRSGLLIELLQAGANPNSRHADEVPLEHVRTPDHIRILLAYGADIKQCRQSPLHNVLKHYVEFKNQYKPATLSDDEWFDELCACVKLFLDAGSDPNQVYWLYHPIYYVVRIKNGSQDEREYEPIKKRILSLLLSYGAEPGGRTCTPFHGNSKNIYEQLQEYHPFNKWIPFVVNERRKYLHKNGFYPLARVLLIGHRKEKTSDCQFARLPRELVRFIGIMVERDVMKELIDLDYLRINE